MARPVSAALIVLASVVPARGTLAAPIDPPASQGLPIPASEVVTETTSEIMARHMRISVTAPQKTLDFFIGREDTSHKKVDPDAESRRQGPAVGPQSPQISSGGGPVLPQTVGVNANGPGSGSSPCGTPPDTMGAIGPTQFISFVNCNIVSYNKATGAADGVLNTTPNNFFNSIRSSGTSDPHVRYDRTSQRWFLFIIDVTFPNNRLLVAVSDTATITGSTTWSFFFVQTGLVTHTNCLADYPTPGIDVNGIYVGVNQFCGASLNTASYAGSDLFVIQKSSVTSGGSIHATKFTSIGPFTPQGVDNSDPTATEGYVIGTSTTSWSRLDLFRVSNPGTSSPTLSPAVHISTANLGSPITQPHQGNTGGPAGEIDGSDNRLYAATLRDGSLWTATTVGTTVSGGNCVGVAGGTADRDAVFWWEIQGIPTGSTPSIRQAGIVCDPAASNPSFYSYGTIAPNGQGQAALGFTIAGSLNFLSAGTAGRLAGDTLSALQSINVYGPGVAAYNPTWDSGSGRGYRRWGDYSFTGLDPCNDMSLWTIQEYTPVANQYGTRFAELKGPPPATPASANPPSVAAGQASVSVVVTGTSSSGSGFYDTPASMSGEPCRTRLSGAVSGVTVNSVTYTDPTHVTLNLDTTAATAGAKNVSVTNPDGQSAMGSGILTITTTCTPPPTPTASNTGPYCAGATVSLSTPTVSGATYSWTGPNSFTSSSQNPTIPLATTAASGTYSVTVTVAGCTSAAGTTNVVVNAVPATPLVTAPPTVVAGSPNWTASVVMHAGSTYAWLITNGSITAGQGTSQITFTAGTAGTPLALSVTETNPPACTSAAGTAIVTVVATTPAAQFHTITPCRQLDTRNGAGTPLAASSTLTVPLTGAPCGIASGATSVSANLTVTQQTAQGFLTIYPADEALPLNSSINFKVGPPRANNAILRLSSDWTGRVSVFNGSGGTVHVVIDVNGYFQ